MHARVSFYDVTGGQADDVVTAFQSAQNDVEQMQGNQGGMLLVDREGKKAITITFWDSEDDLRATAEQANQVRQQAADSAAMSIVSVEAFEVAMEFGR
jgi:heme-degrading monooxygenase HmoA